MNAPRPSAIAMTAALLSIGVLHQSVSGSGGRTTTPKVSSCKCGRKL